MKRIVIAACMAALVGCGQQGAGTTTTSKVRASATAGSAATFTSTDTSVDSTGHCRNGNEDVNCNIYDGKQYVWMNGGAVGAALGDGTYFFAVVEPSGQGGNDDPNDGTPKNLSDDFDAYANRTFSVSAGVVSYGGTHDFDAASGKIRLSPYADTTNAGGVYILAICSLSGDPAYPVAPRDCKFDAFKAGFDAPPPPPPPLEFAISGMKYYDANANGRYDAGEAGIAGWNIDWSNGTPATVTTAADGTFSLTGLGTDLYLFAEELPLAPTPWMQTGNTSDQSSAAGESSVTLTNKSYSVILDGGDVSGLYFGNLCVGPGGGLTLGFWSNKNGQAQFGADDLALLVSLDLRNADGTPFDPADYGKFRTWLLSATATNMAYMLSAQLAAMELNVNNGKVAAGALIYAPGTSSAETLGTGFATVAQVMAEANASLGSDGYTVAQSAVRSYQEALKNALDNANNNRTFVQPTAATCPTPTFF